MSAAIEHFHCPTCHPRLVRGTTPAICGAVIPPAIEGRGASQRCGPCKKALDQHRPGHR
ncbi:hypothetical protein [Streptomyces sp. KY70]|uniref:hypothetical protein n=1 Tax=Streptomyces sp. KY70 TaxID=2772432 RepID=UPI001929FA9D|nr:hypothetical protein [Streptomyces sp. KY70]CAD5959303.1 conserved protein of unknown function [Streptomyces sp. KY75]CAD5980792.1 conserved protein of unknown function [Streptomyces sp. KY70]